MTLRGFTVKRVLKVYTRSVDTVSSECKLGKIAFVPE
jgi:hypothetical protein